ncbi:MAG TPA: hypothetical protein VF950_10750 [Planctomycetota bacterium]
MRKAAALLALSALSGCEDPRIRNLVAEETLSAAKHKGFNYKATLRGALGGDPADVKRLMMFTADAAGALGHGVVLIEVCVGFGDVPSASLAADLSAEERLDLRRTLEAGIAYTRNPAFKNATVASLLPELARRLPPEKIGE